MSRQQQDVPMTPSLLRRGVRQTVKCTTAGPVLRLGPSILAVPLT
jgi:hypothetical protein